MTNSEPDRTTYLDTKVLAQRPYVTIALCRAVIAAPLRRERQADGRWRYWAAVVLPGERDGRILRVVTLADGTLHNAFIDRGYRERAE